MRLAQYSTSKLARTSSLMLEPYEVSDLCVFGYDK